MIGTQGFDGAAIDHAVDAVAREVAIVVEILDLRGTFEDAGDRDFVAVGMKRVKGMIGDENLPSIHFHGVLRLHRPPIRLLAYVSMERHLRQILLLLSFLPCHRIKFDRCLIRNMRRLRNAEKSGRRAEGDPELSRIRWHLPPLKESGGEEKTQKSGKSEP